MDFDYLKSLEDMDKYIVGRRVSDDSVEHHYERIDLKHYQASNPIVLILGGNGTVTDKAANSYAKNISNLLGVFNGDVDILSVNYNHGDYRGNSPNELEVGLITYHLLCQLISENNNRLDIETACKNMRKITIVAHCFGDYAVVSSIIDKLETFMNRVGYDKYEQEQILKQIFMISYGVYSQNDKVKSLNIISPNDETFEDVAITPWYDLLNNLDKINGIAKDDKDFFNEIKKIDKSKWLKALQRYITDNPRCYVMKNGDKLSLATGILFKDDFRGDHDISALIRDENWEINNEASYAGDYTSKCFAVSLCHAVANSILNENSPTFIPFDMEELRQILEGIVLPLNMQKRHKTEIPGYEK